MTPNEPVAPAIDPWPHLWEDTDCKLILHVDEKFDRAAWAKFAPWIKLNPKAVILLSIACRAEQARLIALGERGDYLPASFPLNWLRGTYKKMPEYRKTDGKYGFNNVIMKYVVRRLLYEYPEFRGVLDTKTSAKPKVVECPLCRKEFQLLPKHIKKHK